MTISETVALRDVLSETKEYRGWLYMPPKPWTLNTLGHFVMFDKNAAPEAEGQLPQNLQTLNLQEAADAATIEDTISNSQQQLENEAPLDKLLEAFTYYVDHDAFIRFNH